MDVELIQFRYSPYNEKVRWALDLKGGEEKPAPAEAEWKALIEAARYGDASLVKALIAARADVHARASNGWTALRAAEERGHSDVADLIRAAGGGK